MKPSATRKISTAGKIETATNASTSRVRKCEPSIRRRRSNTSFIRLRATRNTSSTSRMMLRLMRRKKMTLLVRELLLENCGRRVSKNAKSRTASAAERMIIPSRRRCCSAGGTLVSGDSDRVMLEPERRSAPEEVRQQGERHAHQEAGREREVDRQPSRPEREVA